MPLGILALNHEKARLSRPITPQTHGVIDYCHAAFFATFALLSWKRNRRAAVAAAGTSALVLGQSLLTDYRYGLKRVLPFTVHGMLDGGFAALSLAIPKVFGFENTASARVFHGNAFVEATVVGLTDWNNERARAEE